MKKLLTGARSSISFGSDYEVRRLGIKSSERIIVLEYFIPSRSKRYHHYISITKYHPNLLVGPLNENEITSVVDKVMSEHSDYFPKDKVTSDHIRQLVTKISKSIILETI
jgi:hypothetical protein